MAGRLSHAASRIMGGNGIVARTVASYFCTRSDMGLPVGKHIVPDKPLPANDELVWDNGTPFPEPCIDREIHLFGVQNSISFTICVLDLEIEGGKNLRRKTQVVWRKEQIHGCKIFPHHIKIMTKCERLAWSRSVICEELRRGRGLERENNGGIWGNLFWRIEK